MSRLMLQVIQVFRNADRGVSNFLEKSVTKVYISTLLSLQGGGWGVQFPGKKCYDNYGMTYVFFVFQASFVVHIFPPCEFTQLNLHRLAPDLLQNIGSMAHMLIIVTTV